MSGKKKKQQQPAVAIQETGSSGISVHWDKESDLTTVFVPCFDQNGRHYLREIKVAGNNVIDLGRDSL